MLMPDDGPSAAAAKPVPTGSACPAWARLSSTSPGAKACPVTTASFILMYKVAASKAESASSACSLDWAFQKRQRYRPGLHAPPDALTAQIRQRVFADPAPSDGHRWLTPRRSAPPRNGCVAGGFALVSAACARPPSKVNQYDG